MVAFSLNADVTHPPDFALARGGGLARFTDSDALATTEERLARTGYDMVGLECSTWDEDAMHCELADALAFPDYYGHNLDALHDCLYDVAHGDYGWNPSRTGLAITLRDFGKFSRCQPSIAQGLAAAAAHCSRDALLFGHRIIWLMLYEGRESPLEIAGWQVPLIM